jgi:hypothetical protein
MIDSRSERSLIVVNVEVLRIWRGICHDGISCSRPVLGTLRKNHHLRTTVIAAIASSPGHLNIVASPSTPDILRLRLNGNPVCPLTASSWLIGPVAPVLAFSRSFYFPQTSHWLRFGRFVVRSTAYLGLIRIMRRPQERIHELIEIFV